MARHRLIQKKRMDEGDMNLQITSLADILIIVLIFLIKSFSNGMSEAENITISNDVVLPQAQAMGMAQQGMKVEISQGRVDFAGRRIASLKEFRFSRDDLNDDLDSNGTSKSLNAAFKKEKDDSVVTKSPGTIWIVADHRAPYATIQTVIASAAASGYTDFKLAVSKEE